MIQVINIKSNNIWSLSQIITYECAEVFFSMKLKKKLLVEGWRGITHSFSQVNYWQLQSLKKHKSISIRFSDAKFFSNQWKKTEGIYSKEGEAYVNSLQDIKDDEVPDAIYKLYSPFNLSTTVKAPTFVFFSCENKKVHQLMLRNFTDTKKFNLSSGVSLVVASTWVKEALIKFGIMESKIYIIPHGFSPEVFYPISDNKRSEIKSRLNLGDFIFLNISGMFYNKGIDLLLKAFAIVVEKHPKSKLILKGSDSIYPSFSHANTIFSSLDSRIQNLIRDKIIYIGNDISSDNLAEIYHASDCYVSPYRAEGFNLPVLEASACALPVICTKGGPTDDFTKTGSVGHIKSNLISEPKNGDFLEPNFDNLVSLMIESIECASIKKLQARQQSKFISKKYTWDEVTANLINIFFEDNSS